jgi:hypothetical protein
MGLMDAAGLHVPQSQFGMAEQEPNHSWRAKHCSSAETGRTKAAADATNVSTGREHWFVTAGSA